MGPDFLEAALKDPSENQAPLPLKMPQTLEQLLTSARRRTLFFVCWCTQGKGDLSSCFI